MTRAWTSRRHSHRFYLALLGVIAIAALLEVMRESPIATARAEVTDPLDPGAAGTPIEIEAEQGIEWRRNENLYIARGNATAKRGDLMVRADMLTARYRARASGGSEIWQIEAIGHVTMTAPGRTIHGDRAVYSLDDRVLKVTGEGVRIVTEDETVSAEESLEYRERDRTVIARGNATVAQGERRVRADTMTGFFEQLADKSLELVRVAADGNVQLRTKNTVAQGARAEYDLRAEIMTLSGGVKVTNDNNQFNGDNAEVNLKTGVSRLLGGADGSGKVKSLIMPSAEPDAP
jgi:lipopolysaccharide export system protein LptA